jgi:hypothetical protein
LILTLLEDDGKKRGELLEETVALLKSADALVTPLQGNSTYFLCAEIPVKRRNPGASSWVSSLERKLRTFGPIILSPRTGERVLGSIPRSENWGMDMALQSRYWGYRDLPFF